MKLIDCLNSLPDDMLFINLVESDPAKKIKTVAELKAKLGRHGEEEGYEVRRYKTNYGQTTKTSVDLIGDFSLYNEA